MNLKAVIFPHKNDYNNDNNKNNRCDSGYAGDSMISRLILYACLTVKTAIYWNGFSSIATFLLGVDAASEAIDSLRVRQTARRWKM